MDNKDVSKEVEEFIRSGGMIVECESGKTAINSSTIINRNQYGEPELLDLKSHANKRLKRK